MRRFAPALLIVIPIVAFVAWHRHGEHHPFRLAEPTPTTIAALGRVERPATHTCDWGGECFDYEGGWCQAPCTTYSVLSTVISIKPIHDRAQGRFVLVLREGGATIAARAEHLGLVRVGDRVRASGVLFFPLPRGRDGKHAPNGGELSPVLSLRRG